jgi:16S rRNA processing protein RimM
LTETFTIAVAGSPFGLKGFVKVRSFSGETAHLSALKSVRLRLGESEKVVLIEETKPFGAAASGNCEFLLMKFRGIDTPEAAGALKGARLVVDRSQAAPLKSGEFYVEDLKGLAVRAAISDSPSDTVNFGDGELLGHITDILEGGNGELAELRLLSGKSKLVPFRNEFFGDINIEKGWVLLRERWILE